MGIETYSAFTYGHTVTEDNQWINFSENGIDELSVQIDIGAYTLADFATKVAQAMNDVGTLNYNCTVDRETLKLTITADSNFWLYVTTGTNVSISAYGLMGFTTDRSDVNNQESDEQSGSIYYPQFKLQRFVDFDEQISFNQSSVNESASGVVEVVSFGQVSIMECEVTLITDIETSGDPIRNNSNGYQDALSFLQYIITKAPIEFIYDADNLGTSEIIDCLLESTEADNKGTGYKLKELYATIAPNFFSAGLLKFRKL
jgi:hypothetical protein